MDHVHIVVLACHHCNGEHLHEVTYAGRLLASTVCSNCGHTIAKELPSCAGPTSPTSSIAWTKPRRMLRRVIRHPVAFALDLPGALLVKPAKMEAELRVLYGRR